MNFSTAALRRIALVVTSYAVFIVSGVAALALVSTAQTVQALLIKVPGKQSSSSVAQALRAVDPLEQYRGATKLTAIQLKELLHAAGFKGRALRIAWAVAMKESHGRPLAHNLNSKTGDNSYGVFQVNMLGAMGANRREWLGLDNNAQLLDPVTNVKAVYRMTHGGTDWGSWGLGPNAYKGSASNYVVAQWLPLFPSA